MITKSDYIRYLQCPRQAWLNKFRPDLISQEIKDSFSDIMDAGYEVEKYAYGLFPDGKIANGENETRELVDNGGVIFQPAITVDGIYCRADIISHDKKKDAWNIYEVKSSTQVQKIHKYDLAFQKICFEKAGYKVEKTFLVHINNEYVRKGKIDSKKLFKIDDLTNDAKRLEMEVNEGIEILSKIFQSEKEPNIRPVKQCNNPYPCVFKNHCLRDVPEKSIYSISGKLSEKTMNHLLDNNILEIRDIPQEFITERFSRHFHAIKHDVVSIDKEKIRDELQKIQYPIYFLDYETHGSAIPVFDGYRPYQSVVFQYSLHVQKSPDMDLDHFAFLHHKTDDPTEELAKTLRDVIGKEGTLIAWNMGFEKTCNEGMGERLEECVEFFEDINERMYDLMNVFKKGHYIHKDFLGSASLKKVLPVVAPHLSYKKLNIQEGMTASNNWKKMIEMEDENEKQAVYNDLLEYCKLDTLAMVEILSELRKIINESD